MDQITAPDERVVEAGDVSGYACGAPIDAGAAIARRAHIQLLVSGSALRVHWRLLSGNNRELGRGVPSATSVEECRLLIAHLQQTFTLMTARIRRAPTGQWSWDVMGDDGALVTAGRTYPRLIRCRQSLATFAACFSESEVGLVPVDTQARRWAPRAAAVHGRC